MHESFGELLSVYRIDERLIPALSLQLELTFKALNEENIQHAKGLKDGLARLDEKLEQLPERFGFGHITHE